MPVETFKVTAHLQKGRVLRCNGKCLFAFLESCFTSRGFALFRYCILSDRSSLRYDKENTELGGTEMTIILTMFATGTLLGFVGAGGAGFIIAILTFLFHIPIHTALATSLAAMAFTTLSGAFSHYREGNTSVKTGLITGGFGLTGAFAGSKVSALIPADSLHWLTAGMLFLSSFLLMVRLVVFDRYTQHNQTAKHRESSLFWLKCISLGIATGFLAGTFGIGSTPFIQIGLLTMLGLSIRQSVGTTMLIILFIAIGGGTGFSTKGFLDVTLLIQVLAGTMCGACIGAKFTGHAPKPLLKTAMILAPATAGVLLVI